MDDKDTVEELETVAPPYHADSATADQGDAEEHELTFRQACRLYSKAIFWAIALTMTILMEGYDSGLMTSLFAYPSFTRKYGTLDPKTGKYEIPSKWMVALGNAAACGSFVSLLFNGWITEKFGHRRTITMYLTFMAGFIFIVFFAPSIEVLCAGQVLLGVTWGGMAVLGTAYASEVCPLTLRGYLTAFVNICWIGGQLVATGVLNALVDNRTQWSYRIPFAVQWVWILPLLAVICFAPDSPWWLIRKGRIEDARKSLHRLSDLSPEQVQHHVQLMLRTDEYERELNTGSSYWAFFRGTNPRRTEIASMALCAQTLAGEAFAYNASYFFVQAGVESSDAYKLQLGGNGLGFLCTILSWYLLSKFGRRTLLITGLSLMVVDLLLIGSLAASGNPSALWAESAFALLWMGIYASFLAPESFCMAAEISATRLRAPTLSIARNAFTVVNLINRVIEPYLINPKEANLKGKTAFCWMSTATMTLLWAIFRLPETRARTFEELDILFEKRVPAWRFSTTTLDGHTVVGEKDATEMSIVE